MGMEALNKTNSSLLKNSICVLRQAQHERNASIVSMTVPFVPRRLRDERRWSPQTESNVPPIVLLGGLASNLLDVHEPIVGVETHDELILSSTNTHTSVFGSR